MKMIKALLLTSLVLCGTSFGFKGLTTELENIAVQAVSENPDKSVNVIIRGPWSQDYQVVLSTCSFFERQHGKKIKRIKIVKPDGSSVVIRG